MPSPPHSPALAVGVLCAAALALAPAAGASAAALKVPAPAAGEVAVAAAPVSASTTLSVAEAGVPKGAFVTGGIVRAGARRVALIAVARPAKAGAVRASVRAAKGRPAGGAATAALLSTDPPAALSAAVAPACSSGAVAKALSHALRSGPGAPSAAELRTFGQVAAARLCGGAVSAEGTALLGLVGLRAPSPRLDPKPAGGALPAAQPAAPAPAPAPAQAASPPPSSGPTPSGSGAPLCSNGKDDDGDGQVDALGKGAQFFDPGCTDASDASEDSEKQTPRACGSGVFTHGTRRGFGVDFDSLSSDDCPKQMVKGVVDLASPIADCTDPGWEGGKGNASCARNDGALVIATGKGDQWQVYGAAEADLCDAEAHIVGYTADGTAWEQKMKVFDGAEACKTPPPVNASECGDGLDNDGDGQVDFAGLAQAGPDPGCTSAKDSSEDSEVSFPATGCWPIVAGDPGDPTIAYVYVMKKTADSSCPTMNAMWLTFDTIEVQACLDGPYWSGVKAGTCEVKGGDLVLGGGSGDRIAAQIRVSEPITCDMIWPGAIDMRTNDGVVHDGVTDVAYFDADDQLTLCRP